MPKFGTLPRRGKLRSAANFRRVSKVCTDLHALGEIYRSTVPRDKRSYTAWLKFLSQHAPIYLDRRG